MLRVFTGFILFEEFMGPTEFIGFTGFRGLVGFRVYRVYGVHGGSCKVYGVQSLDAAFILKGSRA